MDTVAELPPCPPEVSTEPLAELARDDDVCELGEASVAAGVELARCDPELREAEGQEVFPPVRVEVDVPSPQGSVDHTDDEGLDVESAELELST